MTKIIGVGYRKGNGKDTFANFLLTHLRCEKPNLIVKKVSFADKLKDIANQLYGHLGLQPGIYYESHREEKEEIISSLNLSPRDIWIQVGNKIREIYPRTWLEYVLHAVNADIIIIPDLRFKNEAEAIKEQSGLLFKIIRDDIPQGTDPAEIDLETWENWDQIIFNNKTLNDLNNVAIKLGCQYFQACE